MKNKKEYFFFLLVIGIYLSMNIVFLIKYSNNPIVGDALLYKTIALSFISPCDSFYDAYANLTPGYPGIVALVYYIFGINDLYVYILQILLGLVTIVLFYRILTFLTKTSFISFFFTGLLIANYSLWKFNVTLLMETVTIFILTLSVYYLILYFYKNKSAGLYLFIAIFTLLIFINNRFIFHISILFLTLFIYLVFIKKQYLALIKIGLIFVLLLLPWFGFQYNRYQQFVFFTPLWNNKINSMAGIPKRVDVYTESDKETKMFESYKPDFVDYKNEINDNLGKEYADKFTIDDYNRLMEDYSESSKLKIYEYRLQRFFIPVQFKYRLNGPGDYRLIYPSNCKNLIEGLFITIPLLIMALAGIIISICKANWFSIFMSLLFLSHVALFTLMGFVERYRYSILPVIFILAAYSLFELLTYMSKHPRLSFLKRVLSEE